MPKPLSVEATAELNLKLLRCATRAERNNAIRYARITEQLARDIQELCKEMARAPA